MGEGKGWISIYRKIQDSWLWNEKPFDKSHAWIDLLLSANYQDKKFLLGSNLVDVQRGSFITSQSKLMDKWGWGNTKVRSFLKLLSEDNMIKYSGKKFTLIKILNYEEYQSQTEANADIPALNKYSQIDCKSSANREQIHNKSSANCSQIDCKSSANTNNKVNKDNKENNINKKIYSSKDVLNHFEKCGFGILSPILIEKILADIEIYSPQWVIEAVDIADEKGAHNYSYIKAILESWKSKGKSTKGKEKSYGQNRTTTKSTENVKKEETEGERLARRAKEKYGDKLLENPQCDF